MRNKQLSSNQILVNSGNRFSRLASSGVGSSLITIQGKPSTIIVSDSDSMLESDLFNSGLHNSIRSLKSYGLPSSNQIQKWSGNAMEEQESSS